MRIALIGCGFVVDFYILTLRNHPEVNVVGVMDRDAGRAALTGTRYGLPVYDSLEAVLSDARVEAVVNLTNPKSHFAVSRAALEAGKHVYSEKPLAPTLDEARALVALAKGRRRAIATAPCTVLSEAAQTVGKALRGGKIGTVRLVYAELDDGLVPRMPYKGWIGPSGNPWPAEDEFATGCTLEHAGYALSWLIAFLGPAKAVVAYSASLVPDKGAGAFSTADVPDFSVACVEFESGAVARLTNSIVADRNHTMTFFGEKGALHVESVWYFGSRISYRPTHPNGNPLPSEPLPLVRPLRMDYGYDPKFLHAIDFGRGVAELASAIRQGRACRLGAEYSLHLTEVTLAIQNAGRSGGRVPIASTFDPMPPMPWAAP